MELVRASTHPTGFCQGSHCGILVGMNQYKGYIAKVEYDAEAELIHGEVVGICDVVTFQRRTGEECEKAFHDSVDDYLEFCRERSEKPA